MNTDLSAATAVVVAVVVGLPMVLFGTSGLTALERRRERRSRLIRAQRRGRKQGAHA
jgi:hypothetical protein